MSSGYVKVLTGESRWIRFRTEGSTDLPTNLPEKSQHPWKMVTISTSTSTLDWVMHAQDAPQRQYSHKDPLQVSELSVS